MKPADLHPRHALRHPLFWGALFVLILNDHVLKGAGVLPSALTGKLSDLAGLLVAPVLLAAIVNTKRRGGFVAAHVVVGLVFSLIQLSASAATAWSAAMGAVGFPWVITRDVTDLIALPMLGVSMVAFEAIARGTACSTRRALELAGAGVGMTACLATSPPPEFEEFYESFSANSFLHNESDHDVSVLIRPLDDAARIDCFEVATDPGLYLRDALFGTGELWTMPARTNIPVNVAVDSQRSCHAVQISGDLIRPFVMFWDGEQEVFVEGQAFDADTLPSGGAILIFDDAGDFLGHRSTGQTVSYAPVDRPAEGDACEPISDGDRVDWTDISPGSYEVASVEAGADGCHAFTLTDVGGQDVEWYLCVPESMQPFTAGDPVVISRPDPAGGDVVVESGDLVLAASVGLIQGEDIVAAGRAIAGCELQIDEACGVTASPAEVNVRIGEMTHSVKAGETVTGDAGNFTFDYHVAYAATRHTALAGCSEASDIDSVDAQTVVVQRAR